MGIIFVRAILKKLHKPIIIKKPTPTPRENGIVFVKPCLLANIIAIKLLGPGVKLVITTKTKKENKGNVDPPFRLYVIMFEKDNITSYFLL